MATVHLITGEKKVGKTTAVKKIVSGSLRSCCHGFFTEEMRENDHRVGFRITTLDGQSAVIAQRDAERRIESVHRAGNYVVDLDAFEAIALPTLKARPGSKGITVIDEIGPMQILSEHFRRAVLEIFEAPGVLLGTVVLRQFPWADELKEHSGVFVHVLSLENRDELARSLERTLLSQLEK